MGVLQELEEAVGSVATKAGPSVVGIGGGWGHGSGVVITEGNVVTNAHKIAVTGDKKNTKEYQFFSGYPDGQKTKTLKQMLAGRTAEDVAGIALFLASDQSAYVTGAIIPADGGLAALR